MTASVPASVDADAIHLDDYDFSCQACNQPFLTQKELKLHCKCDRHVYNVKRKLAGLKPIGEEAWKKKVADAQRGPGARDKGRSHLKAGKVEDRDKDKEARRAASGAASAAGSVADGAAVEVEAVDGPGSADAGDAGDAGGAGDAAAGAPPLRIAPTMADGSPAPEAAPHSPRTSLFDKRHFKTTDACLEHMEKTYCFFVPDREYCTDLPGLLVHLSQKINEPPYSCLWCSKKFPDSGSVKRHMLDKKHTRIGSEVFTRTGNVDVVGTEEIQAEIEEFYDFTASVKEVAGRIVDPKRRVAAIVRHFDADKDGCLVFKELAALWAAASTAKTAAAASGEGGGESKGEDPSEAKAAPPLSEAMYAGACKQVDADTKLGLDSKDLLKLYQAGFADLDEHWAMLLELLSQKRVPRRPQLRAVAEKEDEDDEEDSDEDESEPDVIECEDEDEFEEVMRTLGLRAVEFTDTGDLILPDGRTAVHRDMAYIYKQRGERKDEIVVPGGGGGTRGVGKAKRALLMLGASPGTGKLAMSKRQENREGKRVIAVLRRQAQFDMKMGIIQSDLIRPRGSGIRTVRGDMSYGR